ncbi:hypothetical protein IFM89_036005 [Coptis chinensis]|uniref:PORR domain-containing protein n=1 Tax=Coptis chinensis TaxID=261450 RepID=A0A835ITC4_9MAGN|nr:hypothetical protein IFM89_036005 [Coptis chinensis]
MKFPANYKKLFRFGGKIEHFQKRSYLSPYAEFDKRAIAVMHELLSFTLEKRLVTDYLTHFRKELVMPQKLMRTFLKHFGIFYASEREMVQRLIGYRGRKRDIETYNEFSDMEGGDNLLKVDDKGEHAFLDGRGEDTMSNLEGITVPDDSEMELEMSLRHTRTLKNLEFAPYEGTRILNFGLVMSLTERSPQGPR